MFLHVRLISFPGTIFLFQSNSLIALSQDKFRFARLFIVPFIYLANIFCRGLVALSYWCRWHCSFTQAVEEEEDVALLATSSGAIE